MICVEKQAIERNKCLIPCEGIYADVGKDTGEIVDEFTPGMVKIIEAYDKYKNQFSDNDAFNNMGKASLPRK